MRKKIEKKIYVPIINDVSLLATFLLLVKAAKEADVGFEYVRIPLRRSCMFRSNSCFRTSSDTSEEAWQTRWHRAFFDFVVAIFKYEFSPLITDV